MDLVGVEATTTARLLVRSSVDVSGNNRQVQ